MVSIAPFEFFEPLKNVYESSAPSTPNLNNLNLNLKPKAVKPFTLQVKTLDKSFTFEAIESMSIDQVFKQCSSAFSVHPNGLRLVFAGRQLQYESGSLLSDLNIRTDSIIHCIFKLRGGMLTESSGRLGTYSITDDVKEKALAPSAPSAPFIPSVHTSAGKKGDFDVEYAMLKGKGLTPISYAAPEESDWKNTLISYNDALSKYRPLQMAALKAGLADKLVLHCTGGLCPGGLWCVHRMLCCCSSASSSPSTSSSSSKDLKQKLTQEDRKITDQYGSELCNECLNVIEEEGEEGEEGEAKKANK